MGERKNRKNTNTTLTASESEEHEGVDEEELDDIDDHASEGDLERSEVGIDAEDVHQLEGGENVGGGEETL